VAAGVTTALVLTDTQAVRALPNTPDRVRYSSAVSRAGAIYTIGGVVVGSALVAKLADKPAAQPGGGKGGHQRSHRDYGAQADFRKRASRH